MIKKRPASVENNTPKKKLAEANDRVKQINENVINKAILFI
jgi:hypothetical protein